MTSTASNEPPTLQEMLDAIQSRPNPAEFVVRIELCRQDLETLKRTLPRPATSVPGVLLGIPVQESRVLVPGWMVVHYLDGSRRLARTAVGTQGVLL